MPSSPLDWLRLARCDLLGCKGTFFSKVSKGWLVPLVTFSSHVVETIWVTEVRGVEGVDPLDCFGPEAPGRGEIGYLKVHAKSLGGPIVLKEAAIHPKFTCREMFIGREEGSFPFSSLGLRS